MLVVIWSQRAYGNCYRLAGAQSIYTLGGTSSMLHSATYRTLSSAYSREPKEPTAMETRNGEKQNPIEAQTTNTSLTLDSTSLTRVLEILY